MFIKYPFTCFSLEDTCLCTTGRPGLCEGANALCPRYISPECHWWPPSNYFLPTHMTISSGSHQWLVRPHERKSWGLVWGGNKSWYVVNTIWFWCQSSFLKVGLLSHLLPSYCVLVAATSLPFHPNFPDLHALRMRHTRVSHSRN